MSHYDRAVHAVIQCQQSFRSPLAPGRQMFGFLWILPICDQHRHPPTSLDCQVQYLVNDTPGCIGLEVGSNNNQLASSPGKANIEQIWCIGTRRISSQ